MMGAGDSRRRGAGCWGLYEVGMTPCRVLYEEEMMSMQGGGGCTRRG